MDWSADMSGRDPIDSITEASLAAASLGGGGVGIRELVALVDEGRTPMLVDTADPAAVAIRALSVIDLHAAHIGRRVVVAFERGDPARAIVLGVLTGDGAWPATRQADGLELESDGQRLVVSAKSQLVMRCGKSSITLTRAGKVLIEGCYILSRSSGTNRVKGGSVQLN
jgi:hypothetical protein